MEDFFKNYYFSEYIYLFSKYELGKIMLYLICTNLMSIMSGHTDDQMTKDLGMGFPRCCHKYLTSASRVEMFCFCLLMSVQLDNIE